MKRILKTSLTLFQLSLLLLLLMNSCTTNKNAFLNKKYHYITVRYNGFFNGNEAYKLAENKIAEKHKDDFAELLDVFKYGSETSNKDQYSNLDKAMTKGAKMIDRHSMIFKVKSKEVEFNPMIDDSYLLIGKARFLKYDFDAAKETFLYIKNTYETGLEKHKANLWLIMTYIYQENYVDAETTIKSIKSSIEEAKEDEEKKKKKNGFPDKLLDELALVEAVYLKRSRQFELAISAFEKAASEVKKRKLKRRIQYILAQLHEQQGDKTKASELYKLVDKKASNYELQFNAKISLATTYEGNGNGVVKVLEKMLKDIKNKEYQDQIYFALAKIYDKQGVDELAIRNYKLSAKTSVSNPKQKGKSFLALGNYYFDKPDYILASDYYDSTLVVITKDFLGFEEIKNKKESLKDLVKHLKVVQVQDSLLRIVHLSEQERDVFIASKIKKAKEKAEELTAKQEAQKEKALADAAIQGTGGVDWIFENPSLLASGFAQFQGIWGDRVLEDNWRRSDKSSISFGQLSKEEEGESMGIEEELLPEDQKPAYYLKNLPFEKDEQEVANEKIRNSFYQLGIIYRDNFKDLLNSMYYFEKLNQRYPGNTKEAITWYQLYRNYDKTNQLSKRESVKQKVIKNYPESELAQLLLNPNMLADKEQNKAEQEKKYEQIFSLYKQEKYARVLREVTASKAQVSSGDLAGRFNLIYAFAQGNIYGKDSLEFYLRRVSKENIGTLASSEADQLIGRFNEKKAQDQQKKLAEEKKNRAFIVSEKEPHYFVMIFGNEINKSIEILKDVSNLNKAFYSTKSLKSKSVAWSEKEDAIVVKPFKTQKESRDYNETIINKMIINKPELGDFHFIISKTNYAKLFKYKEVLQYMDFFKKHYSGRN